MSTGLTPSCSSVNDSGIKLLVYKLSYFLKVKPELSFLVAPNLTSAGRGADGCWHHGQVLGPRVLKPQGSTRPRHLLQEDVERGLLLQGPSPAYGGKCKLISTYRGKCKISSILQREM